MEWLDIYDDYGNTTGKKIIRGDKSVKLKPNEHIALATIYIENSNGEFLIQKTSKEKGGLYSTTGGHVDSGETPLDAIKREVKEELGVSIDNEKIVYLGYLSYDVPLRYMYYLKTDIDIKDITVQKEEVDYVKYMSALEIKDLIKSERFLKSHGIIFNETLKKIKNDDNEYDKDLNVKEIRKVKNKEQVKMVELHKQNYEDNKKIYGSIERKIREKLGNNVPINHVGSTAIKNMWGKNIIDVLVGAKSEYEMEEFSKQIKDLGFFSGNHSTGMIYRFFASTEEETKSGDIHIHLVYIDSDRYRDFLILRNYLIENAKEAKDYSDFKRELVSNENIIRDDYKRLKSMYVTDLLNRARINCKLD